MEGVLFLDSSIEQNDHWPIEDDPAWLVLPDEPIDAYTSRTTVPMPQPAGAGSDSAHLEQAFKQLLADGTLDRTRVAVFVTQNSQEHVEAERLSAVWNAMRMCPYQNSTIAAALATALSWMNYGELLSAVRDTVATLGSRFTCGPCYTEYLYLEFGRESGPLARGIAPLASLLRAVRPDLSTLLKPEFRAHATDMLWLLSAVPAPSLLFRKEPFVDMFGRYLVPSQAIFGWPDQLQVCPVGLWKLGLH